MAEPTSAVLMAEEATERWCCPLCGGLNSAEIDPRYPAHENFSARGWCQHDSCVMRRHLARQKGCVSLPEMFFPARKLDRLPEVFA